MNKSDPIGEYDEYEFWEEAQQMQDRRVRRNKKKGRSKAGKQNKHQEQVDQIEARMQAMEDGQDSWIPSYASSLDPLHFERQWVIDSLGPFYYDSLIHDVTRLVKGGKEANVYACKGGKDGDLEWIAAKLYRPRMLRQLKNDAVYKAGRLLRDDQGKQMKGRRVRLALRKKTRFGKHVDIMWWIGNEYATQTKLFQAGADVPRPIAHQGNAILMQYIGDALGPAPTLSEISLPEDEAQSLFEQVMNNVALMLNNHYVHGDLSAYNILYWEGRITIIDFPQMVEARHNPHAYELLGRDIQRVCEYFGRFGVRADPFELLNKLWNPYMGPTWSNGFADELVVD